LKRQTSRYIVFLCPKCGAVRYSKSEQKTATCFRCGHQINIDPSRIQILARTNERMEAMEAVKGYKIKLGDKLKKWST